MRFYILVFCFVVCLSHPASGLELHLPKWIDKQSAADFLASMQTSGPDVLVSVDSFGGEEGAALDIAEALLEKRTTLRLDGVCLSACAQYLLPAASKIIATPNAVIAMHGSSYMARDTLQLQAGSDEAELVRGNAARIQRLYTRAKKNISLLQMAWDEVNYYCSQITPGKPTQMLSVFEYWAPTVQQLQNAGIVVLNYDSTYAPKRLAVRRRNYVSVVARETATTVRGELQGKLPAC